MTLHTRCQVGKRVLVILVDGTRIIDHFERSRSTRMVLREHGAIPHCRIRSMTIVNAAALQPR